MYNVMLSNYIHICLTDLNNKLMVARQEGWGEGIIQDLGILMYTQLYLKWITNKVHSRT